MTLAEFKSWLAGYRAAKSSLDLKDLDTILSMLEKVELPKVPTPSAYHSPLEGRIGPRPSAGDVPLERWFGGPNRQAEWAGVQGDLFDAKTPRG